MLHLGFTLWTVSIEQPGCVAMDRRCKGQLPALETDTLQTRGQAWPITLRGLCFGRRHLVVEGAGVRGRQVLSLWQAQTRLPLRGLSY